MKLFITRDCVVDYNDGKGGQHTEAGQEIDIDKDTASLLTGSANCALYANKEDDHTKGQLTATKEDRERVKAQVRERKEQSQAAAAANEPLEVKVARAVAEAVSEAVAKLQSANQAPAKQ